jgi:hypothetical protein
VLSVVPPVVVLSVPPEVLLVVPELPHPAAVPSSSAPAISIAKILFAFIFLRPFFPALPQYFMILHHVCRFACPYYSPYVSVSQRHIFCCFV